MKACLKSYTKGHGLWLHNFFLRDSSKSALKAVKKSYYKSVDYSDIYSSRRRKRSFDNKM